MLMNRGSTMNGRFSHGKCYRCTALNCGCAVTGPAAGLQVVLREMNWAVIPWISLSEGSVRESVCRDEALKVTVNVEDFLVGLGHL